MNIPSLIYAGDTTEWTDSLSDYLASDGYTLQYSLSGKDKRYEITGVADGADFDFTITAAVSILYIPGWYNWQAYVTKGAVRYTVGIGRLEIKTNIATAVGAQEGRSVAQITVDNLETIIKNKSTEGYESLAIGTANGTSKQVTKMSWPDIISAYNFWRKELEREQDAVKIAGGGTGRKILSQFNPY